MSNNETKIKEFYLSEFTESNILHHPEILDLNCLIISNPNWTLYPPNNLTPEDAIHYKIPVFINNFKSLQTLIIQGAFITSLPKDLQCLGKLENISVALCGESDIHDICFLLKRIKNLKILSLTGSIISDETYSMIVKELPNIQVLDTLRSMKTKED
ncbi:leucine-rich repeat domain-containing protein [Pedobacter sandarakinus]|uniref:hypothetical protein n=1 Tax=Pedobacter sandarakinus TaxID=353156 RepID=UPI0022480041|nr:hypothetical protein [Pedobacter sandarakinus]MCX2573584.1 hypothetical protein [Pedobacter sandarakinus]